MLQCRLLVSRLKLLLGWLGQPAVSRILNRATSKLAQGGHANFDHRVGLDPDLTGFGSGFGPGWVLKTDTQSALVWFGFILTLKRA